MHPPNPWAASSASPFLWAHRGASALAPENTLAAFDLARDEGADGIELDVHLSRDGIPVVIHDETLERTTDGRGAVSCLRACELRRLDAGRWFSPAFAGERIPLLSEVLDWAGADMPLNVELKTLRAGEVTLRLLKEFPRCRVLVSSFNHRLLAALRDAEPELPLGFLCDARLWRFALRRAQAARAAGFHPREDLVSAALARRVRDAGLALFPWTVDDAGRAARLLRQGASGLFTNRPGALRQELAGAVGLTIGRDLLT